MRPLRLAWLGVLAAGGACGGGEKPSPAGDLIVTYVASGRPAGAVLLTVTGGAVQGVTASVSGVQVSFGSPAAGTTKIIVTGTLNSGDLLRLRVPDVNTTYFVNTDQVADALTFALLSPAGHTFTVHR